MEGEQRMRKEGRRRRKGMRKKEETEDMVFAPPVRAKSGIQACEQAVLAALHFEMR